MGSTQLSEALVSAFGSGHAGTGPYLTVSQFEEKHPATKNRMRGWIMRADLNVPGFVGLSEAVVRIGRSVILDESCVLKWLETCKGQRKSKARNPHGCVGKYGRHKVAREQ